MKIGNCKRSKHREPPSFTIEPHTPSEQLFRVDLANFVPNDLDELHDAVIDSLEQQAVNALIKRSYFDFAGLKI